MASLGQVSKRLQIIKLAISITDDETINIQRSKLRLYKNDKQLENILNVLDDENYAQASNLINRYIHGPYEEGGKNIETKTSSSMLRDQEEEELIKKFGLFVDEDRESVYSPIEQDALKALMEHEEQISASRENDQKTDDTAQQVPTTEEIMSQYNTIEEDSIPQKHIHIPTSINESRHDEHETLIDNEENEASLGQESEPSVSFHSHKPQDEIPTATDEVVNKMQDETRMDEKEVISDNTEASIHQEDVSGKHFNFDTVMGQEEEQTISPLPNKEKLNETIDQIRKKEGPESPMPSSDFVQNQYEEEPIEYEPISYIDQKLRNMLNQYPQAEETSKRFDSEEQLLYMISLEGYSEADIEKTIEDIKTLKANGKLGEAAHLLLIAAATESQFAQFMLARELYLGEILQRDLPEAFTQINRLAMDDYPEAVCDLAQFYEHGIGIAKDKKKAFQLYEDAFDLGVQRAEGHLTRMEDESRGILEKLFRR